MATMVTSVTNQRLSDRLPPMLSPPAAGFPVTQQGAVPPEGRRIETSTRRIGITAPGLAQVLPSFRPADAGFPLAPQGRPLSPEARLIETSARRIGISSLGQAKEPAPEDFVPIVEKVEPAVPPEQVAPPVVGPEIEFRKETSFFRNPIFIGGAVAAGTALVLWLATR